MLPLQRLRGVTNAGTVGVLALIGALAVPAIAAVQVSSDGGPATIERAAWWLRFGLAEAAFVVLVAAAWQMSRRGARRKAS